MSILTGSRYRGICALIGDPLDHQAPEVLRVGDLFDWPVGVYALGHRHPGNGQFDVDYVGSSVRRYGDVADRIREHLREEDKAEVFCGQVLLPLRRELETPEVRRLEGVVARALGVPRWCKRVPGGRTGG